MLHVPCAPPLRYRYIEPMASTAHNLYMTTRHAAQRAAFSVASIRVILASSSVASSSALQMANATHGSYYYDGLPSASTYPYVPCPACPACYHVLVMCQVLHVWSRRSHRNGVVLGWVVTK